MASEIVQIFLDTIAALFAGIGDGLTDVFNTLIYVPAVGETPGYLTPFAEWMLIFMGFSFALTIFYAIWKKVM